jgi:hypothetical protein
MIAPRIDFVIIRDTVKQKVNLSSRSAWYFKLGGKKYGVFIEYCFLIALNG